MKITRISLVATLLMAACQTTTQTTTRLSVGMTRAEVLRVVGTPFSKSAEERDGPLGDSGKATSPSFRRENRERQGLLAQLEITFL